VSESLLSVGGMRCAHCAGQVKRLLEGLGHDLSVDVDLDAARVRLRGGALPSPEAVARALDAAGFLLLGSDDA